MPLDALARHGQHDGDLLAAVELQEVDHSRSARRAAGLGNFVAAQLIDAAAVGEEQYRIVRGDDVHLLHIVLVARGRRHNALAAALLGAIGRFAQALDIAEVGHGDHHVLFLDQIERLDFILDRRDFGAALVGVLAANLQHFGLDDVHNHPLVGQNVFQVRDGLLDLGVLILQLVALQSGQALQTHIEYGLRLLVGQAERAHQSVARLLRGATGADERNHRVNAIERDEQAFQDVGARLGLVEVVAGAARHNVLLVIDIVRKHVLEREDFRRAVHQRQHDRAEGLLHLRVLEEEVERHIGVHVALQLHDDAHALAVRFVAHVGDAVKALFMHQLGDLLHKARLVDHVGDLGHDDALAVAAHGLDVGARAHDDAAAAGAIGLMDARLAQNQAAGREIGALDELHQILAGAVRMVDQIDRAVDDLAQIVRRDVGGHAHGDAVGAVDQQVREARGQHGGLHQRFIKVWIEINRFLVQIGEHFHRHFGHARLGITHGRRAVAVDRAEVALAVHERIADVEVLRQAHHGVVHGGIAVRVIFTKHIADDTRRFAVRLVGRYAQLHHGIEDTAVNRLETVAHIGQRAGHDHRHGIGDERFFQLFLHIDRHQMADVHFIRQREHLQLLFGGCAPFCGLCPPRGAVFGAQGA